MNKVEDYERIRKAYYIEGLSIREISRRYGHGRRFVRKAIDQSRPEEYQLTKQRPARVLGPFKKRIGELIEESKTLPKKQRYTAAKIYELIYEEGYRGSKGTVQNYVSSERRKKKIGKAYIPLAFDPGRDAQVDWGEATILMKGERAKVQFFAMRLNYSRVRFVMAFPFQKQEAFFEGHVHGFAFFGGVPYRITYDNLKTAVFRILEGHNREEQQAFQAFRSHYLFDSHFCNPAQGHEKGGVENDVGYIQRNFFSPLPEVESFEELNLFLLEKCQQNVHRHIRGQEQSVAELWKSEKLCLLPLPAKDCQYYKSKPVKPNPYSQVAYDNNNYSVPVEYADHQLVLRAYAFRIEVLFFDDVIATHPRCFGKGQDIIDPLHYLNLLAQRPGAFEHAQPIRQWRPEWPAVYEQLLACLRKDRGDSQGVREFIVILQLHKKYPQDLVKQAVQDALDHHRPNVDGVQYQLYRLLECDLPNQPLDLQAFPELHHIGKQPVDLTTYDLLLGANHDPQPFA